MSQSDADKDDRNHTDDNTAYAKNFQRMNGVCFDCPYYLGDECAVGEHCSLFKCCNPEWGEQLKHEHRKTDT
jgi:hypothetical protein